MRRRGTTAFVSAYNDECRATGSGLLGVTERVTLPPKLAAAHGAGQLARPFFVGRGEIADFTVDLTAFFRLLVELPERLFDGDLDRYCAGVGISPARQAVMTRLKVNPVMHGRADLHHDGDSFKLLEFNIGTHLGGTDRAEIMRLLGQDDAFGRFAEREGLSLTHTGAQIARTLRRLGEQVSGDREPVIAFVEADGGLRPYLHLVLAFQEMMARLGLEVRLAEIGQLSSRADKLYLDGTPLDVVLRYFSANQLCADGGDGSIAEPIFRAHEAGRTILYTPLDGLLFEQKTSLAVLSEGIRQGVFDAGELALVDRLLPWTRRMNGALTDVAGERVDLVEYCREHREELLVKPGGSDGGQGLVTGWTVDDREWKETLTRCAGPDWLVQRRVVPRPEPVIGTDGVERDWFATWGMFLTPEGYGGFHVRALPAQDGALVYANNGEVRKTGVFEFPDDL